MTIKIDQGPVPGSESHAPQGPHSNRPNHPVHPHTASVNKHAHDQTPARQREVEVRGHHNRSRVDSHSNRSRGSHGSHRHSHSSTLASLRLDAGRGNSLGIDAGADLLGLKLDIGIGLGNTERLPELHDTLSHLRRTLGKTVRTVADQLRINGRDGRGPLPTIDRTYNYAERLVARTSHAVENRLSHGSHPDSGLRQILSDVSSVGNLRHYFSLIEQSGGEPVSRAYHAVMEFLLTQRGGDFNGLFLASELLRDLQNNAFLNQALEGPFPLTGRARIVNEMIALMRTLDAIQLFSESARGANGGLPTLLLGGALTGRELAALVDQLQAASFPTLPGLAGRLEIPRLVNALGGMLTHTDGRPLLIVDGTPLKFGEMLWLNTIVNGMNASWLGDRLALHTSPFLAYGFDSIFSLIGFDGRSLSLPRFVAIQSQVNAFDFEWMAGEAQFNETWMRFAIELLKDSRLFDHNVLGEMLEEALIAGRFHMMVMRGTVEEGQPVSGSFSFSPVYNFT